MTVEELIKNLLNLNPNSEVYISCEGGCVVDNEISVKQDGNKVFLEIE
ncbi:hypothetical protein [Bacillus thuringiensis]|nr:hypothetical protein [Bacillus thuringiensis]